MAEEENTGVDASLPEEGGEGEENPAEESAGGGSGFNAKKIILFAVLPLFIIIGIGGGLYFSGALGSMLSSGGEEGGHEEAAHDGGHGGHGDHGDKPRSLVGGAHFLPIPDILVNLSSSNGQPRYLRLRVQLELENENDAEAVESVMPRVIDQFQTYLRELREKDLRGSAGIYRLQIELLARVNAAAYPVEVKDVLFQEILIQ